MDSAVEGRNTRRGSAACRGVGARVSLDVGCSREGLLRDPLHRPSRALGKACLFYRKESRPRRRRLLDAVTPTSPPTDSTWKSWRVICRSREVVVDSISPVRGMGPALGGPGGRCAAVSVGTVRRHQWPSCCIARAGDRKAHPPSALAGRGVSLCHFNNQHCRPQTRNKSKTGMGHARSRSSARAMCIYLRVCS
jgi:hypothetical protein